MSSETEVKDVQLASEGIGPLYQRDYWATILDVDVDPEDVIKRVRTEFPDFAPPETAYFKRCVDGCEPLVVGDELDINISKVADCRVRVSHVDRLSLTLRTLDGHPEAGRITFSAEKDEDGRLVFRIRSRARSHGLLRYLGFLLIGRTMQGRTWIRFIKRLAKALGGRIEGDYVSRKTVPVDDRIADEKDLPAPTYAPRGDRPDSMAIWRIGRGWSEDELRRHLAELADRTVNFDVPPAQMTAANGWTIDGANEVPLGTEPPGPPVEDGFYHRARQAIINYDFSDPTIVIGHFDPKTPFVGRDILLEFKVLKFRFLNGCRVHSVREESDDSGTTFGFRYDTLQGHIEQGFEWFLLVKEHETGKIHFTIEAHWRLGDFPTWWSKLGFKVIGERYRALWRRRAATRLARLAHLPNAEAPISAPGALAHRGDEVETRSEAVGSP